MIFYEVDSTLFLIMLQFTSTGVVPMATATDMDVTGTSLLAVVNQVTSCMLSLLITLMYSVCIYKYRKKDIKF